jgi:hypothetical protein
MKRRAFNRRLRQKLGQRIGRRRGELGLTIAFMKTITKPWIAFKALAAGAIYGPCDCTCRVTIPGLAGLNQ